VGSRKTRAGQNTGSFDAFQLAGEKPDTQRKPEAVVPGLSNPGCCPRSSCYTDFVLKNMTITVSQEAARWARKKAAEENTSVSKLVGRMLEDQMRRTDEYWKAYERWKKIGPIKGFDASKRLSRDQVNERR
jgi:hypothetical protein